MAFLFDKFKDMFKEKTGEEFTKNEKEQKDIQDSFKLIDNSLSKFHSEIKSTHYVRQSLENEITKLKNIIKRQNKHNKQKER